MFVPESISDLPNWYLQHPPQCPSIGRWELAYRANLGADGTDGDLETNNLIQSSRHWRTRKYNWLVCGSNNLHPYSIQHELALSSLSPAIAIKVPEKSCS